MNDTVGPMPSTSSFRVDHLPIIITPSSSSSSASYSQNPLAGTFLEVLIVSTTANNVVVSPSLLSTTQPPNAGGWNALPLGARVTIITYCYILPIICILGFVGNVMNVITLASRRLRAVSYMYLRALAIADLLCMIYVMVFVTGEVITYLGFSLNQYYWYGIYQAHFMLSFINWALATGVYVVTDIRIVEKMSPNF